MAAYAPANRSEGVRDPGVTIGFLVPPLRNQGDIASRLRVDGTSLHAGKVGLEPLEVDEFGSALHEKRFRVPCWLLLDRQFHGCCGTADVNCLRCWLAVFAPGLQDVLSRSEEHTSEL